MSKHQVVIIGGGFAGLAAARGLASAARRGQIVVTIIDRQEYQSFTPLLYEVATGYDRGDDLIADAALSAAARVDLREAAKRYHASFVQGEVLSVDHQRKMVCLQSGRELPYNALVISPGSVADCFMVDGAVEHGFTLKTVADAIRLRDQIILAAKSAQVTGRQINVVIAGAGATGVELAGELKRMADRHLSAAGKSVVRLILVESRPRPLVQLPMAASAAIAKRLMKIGVELRVNTYVNSVRPGLARLTPSGQTSENQQLIPSISTTEPVEVPCDLFIWTAGICGSPSTKKWGYSVDNRGRLTLPASLELPGQSGIFAIGDAVSVIDPVTNSPFPWHAQGAMRQGNVVAQNILKFLATDSSRVNLSFANFPIVVTAGGKWGVLTVGNITISGFIAWCGRKFADAKYFFTALPFRSALSLWWGGLRIFSKND